MNKMYAFLLCILFSGSVFLRAEANDDFQRWQDEQNCYMRQALVQATVGGLTQYFAKMHLDEFAQDNSSLFKCSLVAVIALVAAGAHYSCSKKEREASNPLHAGMIGFLSSQAGAALMAANMRSGE